MDNSSDKPPRGENTTSVKDEGKKPDKNDKKKVKSKRIVDWGWTVKVALSSIVISIVMTFLSNEVLDKLHLAIAFAVLLLFIIINIVFDVIGMSVATADIKPFLSMSARKLKAGTTAVNLIKNAEKVSNFCSDVVGDIAGVVSGSTGVAIIIRLFTDENSVFWGNLVITALVSGITVGGKAIGKAFGMKYSNDVVKATAKFLSIFSKGKSKDKETKE